MKKLIVSLFALVAFVAHTQEAAYAPVTLGIPSAQTIAVASGATPGSLTVTNSSGGAVTLDVRKQQNVAIQVMFRGHIPDANSSNIVFTLQKSVDGTYWDTNTANLVLLTNAINGATNTVYVHHVNNAGIGYYKLATIANYSTNLLTNVVIKYGIKLHSP